MPLDHVQPGYRHQKVVTTTQRREHAISGETYETLVTATVFAALLIVLGLVATGVALVLT